MSAERPILFSAPMVRAILAGTKTQTRRRVKDEHLVAAWPFPPNDGIDRARTIPRCPYGQPGGRLWVRETWKVDMNHRHYRADEGVPGDLGSSIRWIPSIHMPRWASRITLEVSGVRVERLQGISEADALAEGWPRRLEVSKEPDVHRDAARDWYMDLWESINGPGSWAANPWVWVVEFKQIGGEA